MPLYNFTEIALPYFFEKQKNDRYVFFNREYEPIGFNKSNIQKPKNYPISKHYDINAALARQISFDNSDNLNRIFLYGSSCIPTKTKKNMDAYLKRLAILAGSLDDFIEISLPYCLEKQKDGGYVALNQKCNPIGFNVDAPYNYEDYPISTQYKITKAKARKASFDYSDDLDRILLYDDSCAPKKTGENMFPYLEKLAALLDVHKAHKKYIRAVGSSTIFNDKANTD